jgi:hypothetical protein
MLEVRLGEEGCSATMTSGSFDDPIFWPREREGMRVRADLAGM